MGMGADLYTYTYTLLALPFNYHALDIWTKPPGHPSAGPDTMIAPSVPQSVCVIGAGFSGVATARTLSKFGYEVTVFDKTPDVGGVWSKTRRYPGVSTQNTKDTYHLSEMPMPDHYPAWPSGAQVQAYMEVFVKEFDLEKNIRLNTEVISAEQDPQTLRWTVRTRRTEESEAETNPAAVKSNGYPNDESHAYPQDRPEQTHTFDILLVANGTFSDTFIPNYPGMEAFTAAGGKVCHTSHFTNVEEARGKDVIIVGYGKSACDCAVALSKVAGSTTVVARKLIWKLPKFIAGLCYKYLFLGRVGECLFEYIRPGRVMRLLHGPLKFLRNAMISSVETVVRKQIDMVSVDAVPPGHFEDIARASISLQTEDFFESLKSGRIQLRRDTQIEELVVQDDGKPAVRLSTGEVRPADIVCCGTGFYQRAPFLDQEKVMKGITDDKGNFLLYRMIKPIENEKLYFIGYNSSLFCPTSSETAALWVVADLDGAILLPSKEAQKADALTHFNWLAERSRGKHSHGTNIVPFSLHNIDDILKDISIDISGWDWFKQWLLPVRPAAYSGLAEKMLKRRLQIKAKTD